MKKTNSKADKWPIPSDKDLLEIRQHNLNDELKELLYGGQGKFEAVAKRIQEQFSYDQLAIIVANQIIGTQKSAHEISLTGENSNNRKGHSNNRKRGGHQGGSNRNRRSFGGNHGDRNSSGDSRHKKSYGGKRKSNSSDRRSNQGSRNKKS